MAKRKRSIRESDFLRADGAKKAVKSQTKALAPQADTVPRTRAAKTITFGNQVIGVTELLEKILLFLPLQDLFVLQRVSKTWQSTIIRCPAIRKKMFLEAEGTITPGSTTDWQRRTLPQYDARKLHLNPILAVAMKESHLKEPSLEEELPFSPLVIPIEPYWDWDDFSNVDLDCDIASKVDPTWSENKVSVEASWRRMLLTQPPVTRLGFAPPSGHPQQPPATLGALRESSGIPRPLRLRYQDSADDMSIIMRRCKHYPDWEGGICGCLSYIKHGLE